MKKLYVADRQTGTFMEEVSSINEGIEVIKSFEEEDKDNEEYEPGYYDIVDEEHHTVYSEHYGIDERKRKDTYIRFRCTEAQKAMIKKNAELCSQSVTDYLLMLATKDNREDSPEEMLKRIGCTNYSEIKTCRLIYKNACEKSYEIVTDLGEVDFRIIELHDGKYSKLDYFNTDYKFDRNVNLLAKY